MSELDIAEKKINEILEERDLIFNFNLTFPEYKKLPEGVKLALHVLNEHKMTVVLTIKPRKE
jgi:hypothetical protein|tara:strand:- start:3261 stop:3446 length:186 start_codon:yes stop_codon:yes gene_type:complete